MLCAKRSLIQTPSHDTRHGTGRARKEFRGTKNFASVVGPAAVAFSFGCFLQVRLLPDPPPDPTFDSVAGKRSRLGCIHVSSLTPSRFLSVFLSAPSRFLFSLLLKISLSFFPRKLRGNQLVWAQHQCSSAKSAKYRGILWVYLENPGYARVLRERERFLAIPNNSNTHTSFGAWSTWSPELFTRARLFVESCLLWRHVVVHLRTRGVSLVLPSGTATRKNPRQIHPPARSPAPLHTNSAPHDRLASPPLHCPLAGCRRCRRRHTPLCSCRRER